LETGIICIRFQERFSRSGVLLFPYSEEKSDEDRCIEDLT
jgi:hypothetical protein